MSTTQWPDNSMFKHFDIFEETYKTVDSHDIKAAILIPKNATPGVHPVVFNIHGGFLTHGHALFAPFFSPWALKLALENTAVVVSVDYRLLPSANGVADVLEDLEDSWQWTHSRLPAIMGVRTPGHSLDFSRLLLSGQSAGGYGAAQIALSHPNEVSAMAIAYPFVDPADDAVRKGPSPGDPTILRFPMEDHAPIAAVEAWIEHEKKTVTTRRGFDGDLYSVSAAQNGIFYSKVFDNRNLARPDFLPINRIRAGAKLPKNIWILHGDDDSVVYVRTAHKFVDLVREKLPETTVRLDIAAGEDHAFDLTKSTWELHAIGALDYVKKSWLGD